MVPDGLSVEDIVTAGVTSSGGRGPTVGAAETPLGRPAAAGVASGAPAAPGAPWTDPSGDALGLALLAAVVQELAVEPVAEGPGTRVLMSWPLT